VLYFTNAWNIPIALIFDSYDVPNTCYV